MSTSSTFLESDGRVPLRWSRYHVGDACIVSLAGELDLATCAELRQVLMGVARTAPAARIVLNMGKVSMIDASCLGVVVEASAAARGAGRVLRVAGLKGMTARVFELAGLQRLAEGRDGSGAAEE